MERFARIGSENDGQADETTSPKPPQRRSKFAALLAAILSTLPLYAEEPLVVGMELAYPPFEMTDTRGNPDGVSVVLAEALGEHLGRPVEILNTPFQGLIPALRTGKIDLILSSMTRTDARERAIDFSEPYLTTGLTLLVHKDSAIESIDELNRPAKTVAVKQGTTGHLYATRHLDEARILVLDKESSAVLEVVQGKADAFIYDQMSVYQHWRRNPDTTRALLDPFQKEYWAVGIRKENDALREEINEFFREYRSNGGFEKLGERFLPEQKAAFAELGYPFVF